MILLCILTNFNREGCMIRIKHLILLSCLLLLQAGFVSRALFAQKNELEYLTKIARLEDFYHRLNNGNTRNLHIMRNGQIAETDSVLGYTATLNLFDIDPALLSAEKDSSSEGMVLVVHCKHNLRCIRVKNHLGKEKYYKTYEMFALEHASPSITAHFKNELLELINQQNPQ